LAFGCAFGAGVYMAPFIRQKVSLKTDPYSKDKNAEDVPGDKLSAKKVLLGSGANMMQNFAPINAINQHASGIYFISGNLGRQVHAHHFCANLNEDMLQCALYDSDKSDAKLIGVHYIISEKVFKTLPDEEKKLWHSHVYEVKSGVLQMPRLPEIAENAVMRDLVGTYGKSIYTWQVDRGDDLPYGVPQLLMSFTQPGQLNVDMLKKRDDYYKTDTLQKRKARDGIQAPAKTDPSADWWEKSGKAWVLEKSEQKMKQ